VFFNLAARTAANSITVIFPATPSRGNNISETGRLDPVVLKTKYGRFGDGSGNLNLEGNVALP
jgi:hypothetical protein